MVGTRTKPKKSNQALWLDYYRVLWVILDIILSSMMKRIVFFFLMTTILLWSCNSKPQTESAVEDEPVVSSPARNDRPPITVRLVDGTDVNVKTLEKNLVLVLFQPDCDHCQDEAKQIQKRLDAFANYQMYFISSEPLDVILQFSKDYDLINKPNVHFGSVPVDDVVKHFGSIATPSIYIYKKSGELVQNFDGLVDIEVVIKYL
jgi:thioredoxin-related protein